MIPISGDGASYDHMKKAAAKLCRLGSLKSVRGRIGGVTLARHPEEIRIGDAIRATEGHVTLVESFDAATNACPLEPAPRPAPLLSLVEDGTPWPEHRTGA